MGTKTLFEYESYCICLCAGGDNLYEGQGLTGKFVIPVEGCQAHCMGSGLKKHLSHSFTSGFAWAQHLTEVGRKWWTRPCHGQGLSHYSELRAYRESNSSPWGGKRIKIPRTPHVLWMISTPDGSFSPTSIRPSPASPGCSSLPSSFWPPAVFITSSMREQLGYRGCLLALSTSLAHTVDPDFSSTLENKKGDAGQNNSNFWLVSGAQTPL